MSCLAVLADQAHAQLRRSNISILEPVFLNVFSMRRSVLEDQGQKCVSNGLMNVRRIRRQLVKSMMLTRNCLASVARAVSQYPVLEKPPAPYPKRARQSATPCRFRRPVVQNTMRSAALCEPCLAEGAERAPCNPRQCQWCTRASQAGATHKNEPIAVIRTVSVHSMWSPCVNEARSASTCRCRGPGCPQTANKVSDHPWK